MTRVGILGAGVLLAVSLIASEAAQAADPIGQVVAATGNSSASGPGGQRVLTAGSEVFENDRISTLGGNAQIALNDGTKLVVGPGSSLVLNKYVKRNSSTARKVGVKAVRGTFRLITGNSSNNAYEVDTGTATIGIRGTSFDCNTRQKTICVVTEGRVRLRGKNGQVVNLEAGCGVGEAGVKSTKARELEGAEKADALRNNFPYIENQEPLEEEFRVDNSTCLIALGQSSPGSLTPAQAAILGIPGIVIGGIVINEILDEDDPLSADGGDDCQDEYCGPIDP